MQKNVKKRELKHFNASTYRVGIVVAQFNSDITDKILGKTLVEAKNFKLSFKNIQVEKVAGSIELPVALQAMAKTKRFDCLVAIGCVVRGQTVHFDYVNKLAAEGIQRVSLDMEVPIGFGVLMCENKSQARARLSVGAQALKAALGASKMIKEI